MYIAFQKSKYNCTYLLQVTIYQPNGGKGFPIMEAPPSPPQDSGITRHSYHDLPSRYWKKYQYASRFILLVRSKTPKVTLYTPDAKCMLMENGPTADYEACFYSGGLTLHANAAQICGSLNCFLSFPLVILCIFFIEMVVVFRALLARISELGVHKVSTHLGELGVQFLFIPLHYTQKI